LAADYLVWDSGEDVPLRPVQGVFTSQRALTPPAASVGFPKTAVSLYYPDVPAIYICTVGAYPNFLP